MSLTKKKKKWSTTMPSRRQRQSKYRKWMNEFTSGQLEVASFWTFWKKSWCWLLLVVMAVAVTVTVMMMKWRTNGKPIKIIFFPNSVRISNPIKGMRVCVCTSEEKSAFVRDASSLLFSLSIIVQMSIYSNCCRFRCGTWLFTRFLLLLSSLTFTRPPSFLIVFFLPLFFFDSHLFGQAVSAFFLLYKH